MVNKENLLNKSGIYLIFNIISGKRYIGSATCFRKRWTLHKSRLKRNVHTNTHLQNSWNKYGEEKFMKVYQYDLNNNFIREWESEKKIKQFFNTKKTHVSDCCNNSRKSWKGFIWKH